jgi:release factor glutamine methyltransferase
VAVNAILAEPTVERILRGSGLPRREAELLLGLVLGRERAYVIAHAADAVDAANAGIALDWFARRRSGEPVAYITGRREFYGLDLHVTPDVLIPRPESEQLVELALERISAGAATRLLDLGTGSGAVAIALAKARPEWQVSAADVSDAALKVARENARRHGVAVEFLRSDWFEALEGRRFELIVSNPPYVAAGDPHLDEGDVRFEPRLALAGGAEGMRCIDSVAVQARDHLLPGGWLLLEHGHDQQTRCISLLKRLGYAEVRDHPDLAGLPRICCGRLPG